MGDVVVLVHTDGAGPSAFTQVLDSRTALGPWRRVDVPRGEPLPPDPDDLAGLVVLGGKMSAVDPDAHSWMPAELDLLRRAVEDDLPVLGVCLGAQLLGQALGGEIARRDRPEVGFVPLHRTEAGRDDEVVGGWPDGAATLFVHEDEVVALPPGAVAVLEGNDGQGVWRAGSALAVQAHPEVTADQLASWVESGLLDDLLVRADADPDALVEEARRRDRFTVPTGRALLGRFLDGPVRTRVA